MNHTFILMIESNAFIGNAAIIHNVAGFVIAVIG